jgi:hypothetical protein
MYDAADYRTVKLASPIVPLATSLTLISHLPGESFNAIGS